MIKIFRTKFNKNNKKSPTKVGVFFKPQNGLLSRLKPRYETILSNQNEDVICFCFIPKMFFFACSCLKSLSRQYVLLLFMYLL